MADFKDTEVAKTLMAHPDHRTYTGFISSEDIKRLNGEGHRFGEFACEAHHYPVK